MKKKVKKIPKYNAGGSVLGTIAKNNAPKLPTYFKSYTGGASASYTTGSASGYTGRALSSGGGAAAGEAGSAINIPGGIATASNELLMNTLGIEDNSTEGVMLNSAALGSDIGGSIMPGLGHLIGAVAGGVLGAFKKGSVDPNTGEIQYGGIFGRSGASLRRESNIIKGSILAKARTEDLQANWMNQGINPAPNVLAAEGGIVPGEHYASRGEVEVAADGTNAVRYGWDSKGKDTYHVYTNPDGSSAVGNLVFTEEGVKRPNGEKYSDAAEKIIKGTKEGSKLRQISLRKLANEMEEQKMGKLIKKIKNGIPAHEGGKNGTIPDLSDMFLYRQPDGKFVMLDINGNRYDVPEMMLPYIQGDEHGYWFGPQTGVAPSAGKWNGSMNFAKQMLNSKNIAKLRNTMINVLPKGAKQTTVSTAGKGAKAVQAEKEMLNNDRTFQMWQRMGNKGGIPQKTLEGPQTWATARGSSNLWENPMALLSGDDIASAINTAYYLNKGLPTAIGVSAMLGGAGTFLAYEALKDNWGKDAPVQTTIPMQAKDNLSEETKTITTVPTIPADNEKKNEITVSKPSSGKKTTTTRVTTPTTSQEEKATPEQFAENLKSVLNGDIGERHWLRNPIETKSLARVAFENAPKPIAPPFTVLKPEQDADVNYSNPSWLDWLYRTALLTQPLWDRAKAEPVKYDIRNAKYIPVGADPTPLMRSADETYGIGNYNFAQFGGSTGQRMAYGVALANNRAKQYADAYKWQQDVQNKQIAQNVGIYNDWDADRSSIMNSVYDKTAANRATARNINRQNRTAALLNYGQMLRDDKQFNVDIRSNALKTKLLEPFIQSVYENSDELMPVLAQYGISKNIKKKQSNR